MVSRGVIVSSDALMSIGVTVSIDIIMSRGVTVSRDVLVLRGVMVSGGVMVSRCAIVEGSVIVFRCVMVSREVSQCQEVSDRMHGKVIRIGEMLERCLYVEAVRGMTSSNSIYPSSFHSSTTLHS